MGSLKPNCNEASRIQRTSSAGSVTVWVRMERKLGVQGYMEPYMVNFRRRSEIPEAWAKRLSMGRMGAKERFRFVIVKEFKEGHNRSALMSSEREYRVYAFCTERVSIDQ